MGAIVWDASLPLQTETSVWTLFNNSYPKCFEIFSIALTRKEPFAVNSYTGFRLKHTQIIFT